MEATWWNDWWERVKQRDPAALAAVAGGAIILLLLALFAGRQAVGPTPSIPGEISRGKGVEPRLSVYFHEVDQVRHMDIEDYLLGVVAAEMEPTWPLEALKAQAIIARTFTLKRIDEAGKIEGRDAHASTDPEEFQAYDSSRINDNVHQAINETRGQVVVYRGDLVRTWFHAFSGGHTTTPQEGLNWPEDDTPYLHPVDDSDVNGDEIPEDVRNWEVTFSSGEVQRAVQEVNGQDPGEITSVAVQDWSDDGRALTLKFNDIEVNAAEFRLAVGSTEMKSTMITDLETTGDEVIIRGSGYGHGVGLSQWSAYVLAGRGQTAEQILKRYYKGIRLVRLWR